MCIESNDNNPKAVIAIGNPLKGDDAVSIRVLERLHEEMKAGNLSEGIDLLDIGSRVIELMHHLPKYETVIIMDAVKFGADTGVAQVFDLRALEPKEKGNLDPHHPDLFQLLEMTDRFERLPEQLLLFAMEPGPMELGEPLSCSLENKMDEYTKAVMELLRD